MGVSKRLEVEKWFFIIFTTISILLVFILGLSILFVFVHKKEISHPDKILSHTKFYQYLQLNPTTNETSIGLVSVYEDLGLNEFVSYEDFDGNHILISNVGSNEYQCSGGCVCDDDNNSLRRSQPFTLSRGITYLVAAVSTILASQKAREYFEEFCNYNLKEICSDETSIRSEFKECDLVSPHEIDEGIEFGEKTIIFLCHGNCMPNIYDEAEQPDYEVWDDYHNECKDYGCEKMNYENEVWIDPYIFVTLPKNEKEDYDAIKDLAESVFMEHHLKYFCIENSWKELDDYTCDDFENEMMEDHVKEMRCEHVNNEDVEHCLNVECEKLKKFKFKRPMCVGHSGASYMSSRKDVDNPSVVCREMRRKTTAFQQKVLKEKE